MTRHAPAGNARVKDCLEEHREDPKFTQECRTEFETMMGRRATDFRLDSSLREQCAEDIEVVCGYEKVRAGEKCCLIRPGCCGSQYDSPPQCCSAS